MEPNEKNREPMARGALSGQPVRVIVETTPVKIPTRCDAAKPLIEVIRDGDIVQAIDVTCTCGKKIRLRCTY